MLSLIYPLAAATATSGLLLAITGLTPRTPAPKKAAPSQSRYLQQKLLPTLSRKTTHHILIGLAAGLIATLITGILAFLIIGPIAGWLLPTLFAPSAQNERIELLQGLESWTRSLSGVLVAGSGIEDAILASQPSAPKALKPSLETLTARLRAGQNIDIALHAWADEIDDATADMIAVALLQGGKRRGGLSTALDELAEVVSDRVRVAQQIEADRATPHTTVRTVTIITLLLLGVMAFFSPSFRTAYSTGIGQIVITVLSLAYLASLWWIHNIVNRTDHTRFLHDRSSK